MKRFHGANQEIICPLLDNHNADIMNFLVTDI